MLAVLLIKIFKTQEINVLSKEIISKYQTLTNRVGEMEERGWQPLTVLSSTSSDLPPIRSGSPEFRVTKLDLPSRLKLESTQNLQCKPRREWVQVLCPSLSLPQNSRGPQSQGYFRLMVTYSYWPGFGSGRHFHPNWLLFNCGKWEAAFIKISVTFKKTNSSW